MTFPTESFQSTHPQNREQKNPIDVRNTRKPIFLQNWKEGDLKTNIEVRVWLAIFSAVETFIWYIRFPIRR